MAVEDGNKPTPDPTVLTTEQLIRSIQAERDYTDAQLDVLRQRLTGMDEATKVLNETVTRTPTEIQKEVAHLRELSDEKWFSVQTQFKERDTRQERESRDNKVAVDAAFAAQKEAAAKQDEANAKAIDKSEKATAETIKTNQELSQAKTDALTKTVDELRLAVSRIESTRVGAIEQVGETRAHATDQRASINILIGVAGAVIAALVLVLGLYATFRR